MRRLLLPAGVAALALTTGVRSQDRVAFRANVDAVLVEVSVLDGRKLVPNLTQKDFLVLDNGVEQKITDADTGRLPIDVRLVFDTSGSVSDSELERYLKAMKQISAALAPDDRCEILQFRSHATRIAELQAAPVPVAVNRDGPDGTAFFDAVGLAAITPPRPGRRQLTILLSDGTDTASFFDLAALDHAAARSESVIYAVLPTSLTSAGGDPFQGRTNSAQLTGPMILETLSTSTGGRVIALTTGGDVGAAFLTALREFREGYRLSYVATGVQRSGWHTLAVSVRGHKYTIRAKRGYAGI